MTIKKHLILTFLAGVVLLSHSAYGDPQARAIIDTLRWGFDFKSAEAFKRANRAQQLDSTYYVGYLIEGYHYYEKAEEHTGLARAIEPLQKAIDLFENDFGYSLDQKYQREDIFAGAWRDLFRQLDYFDLCNRLINCYISLEMPDSAYSATMRLKQWDLPYDFQSFHWLAWLYFRTRIYTGDKYPFLKNSIEENLSASLAYTDSLELKLKRNEPYLRREILGSVVEGSGFYNSFREAFLEAPLGVAANTRGILYGYNLRPQLAASYFKKMNDDESVAKMVNLGFTYHSDIDFRTSEEYFAHVPDRGSRSRGGHWQGYSTIFVYKGDPLEGALQLREERDKHGFTIGYGWDNLCLSRMYLYSGYIDESATSLAKADNFTEVHYNTSFREDQYRFMIKTLRLMKTIYKLKAHQFENKHRWLSPGWWKDLPELMYTKYTTLYQLANELALNPERDMVYYHIFHTESIISFDELWYIIKNYSHDFFRDTFFKFSGEDPRENLDRYYNYFIGKLMLEDGKNEAAYDMLTSILNDSRLDKEYEKLLIARIHENCAVIAGEEDWIPQEAYHLNEMYRNYPQLIPFSDVQMAFRLTLSDELKTSDRPAVQEALEQLEDVNINWEPGENQNYPEVQLGLQDHTHLRYQVIFNREVFVNGTVDLTSADAGKNLAYRLFKILK